MNFIWESDSHEHDMLAVSIQILFINVHVLVHVVELLSVYLAMNDSQMYS